MGYQTELQGNNTDLQNILNIVNDLPKPPTLIDLLPTMGNPAGAEQIVSGYQGINQNGEVVTGSLVQNDVLVEIITASNTRKVYTTLPRVNFVVGSVGGTNVWHNQMYSIYALSTIGNIFYCLERDSGGEWKVYTNLAKISGASIDFKDTVSGHYLQLKHLVFMYNPALGVSPFMGTEV